MKTLLIIALSVVAVVLCVYLVLVVRDLARPAESGSKQLKKHFGISVILFAAIVIPIVLLQYVEKQNKVEMRQNPFFAPWNTMYGVPPFDKIQLGDYAPAFERAMAEQNEAIAAIVQPDNTPTFESVIEALDRSSGSLNSVANVFFMLALAETSPEMQELEAELSPKLSAHIDAVILNDFLFEKVKAVYDHREELCGGDSAKLRLTEKYYKRFVRNGALLPIEQKAELQRVNEELSLLEVKFTNNLLAATNDYKLVLNSKQISGLPSSLITAAEDKAQELGYKNRYVFTLHAPSWIPFMTHSSDEKLRKELYQAYLNRCAAGTEFDNTQIINDIIRLRLRKANLLGFNSYAAFVLDDVMAGTPERVYDLLDALWEPALDKAKEELEAMRAEKHKDYLNKKKEAERRAKEEITLDGESEDTTDEEQADQGVGPLDSIVFNSWDWWYYAERVKRVKYSFDEESIRPFLSLTNVRQGIFDLSNRLYGVTFRPINVPVYHSECQTYEVLDRDNTHLGVLYMDFFPREGKAGGAWCGEFRTQSYTPEGERVSPVVSIVCNFSRPLGSSDALLTIDETLTFFHEFGHALHNLFKDVPYEGLSDVERDFVELPSQLLENWAFQNKLLKTYAVHNRSGEIVPDRILRRYRRSSNFNKGFATVELLAAAYIDLDLHSITEYGAPIDLAAYESYMLANKRGLIPQIEPRYRYPYFKHIFGGGYASGYYSYLWSEVLDKDAYQAFVETGDIFDRKTADRFRATVLSQGGMKSGMELYKDFRGAEPSREPLLKARDLWVEPVADSLAADSLAGAAATATNN